MKTSRALRHALLGLLLGTAAFATTASDSELAALIGKAEKGNAIAQYNLGLTYAEGRGIPVDPIEAYVWLSLAQENGARGRALEILLLRMGPGQIEIARARLEKRRTALGLQTPAADAATPAPALAATDTPPADAAERELAQARLDKQQLSNELAAAWKENDQLKAELAQARATPTPATDDSELARRMRELQTAQAELEQARRTQAETAAALERTNTERTGLERMLAQAQQAALDLGRQVDALNARSAQSSAAPATPAYPDLRERTADLEAQVAALRDAHPAFPDLRARVAELEQQLAAAPAQPAAPSYPDLRSRVTELESQLGSAREQSTGVETELQTVRTQLTHSQRQTDAAETDLRRARAAQRELETALAAARATADRAPAAPAYPDLRERVAELEAQVAALRDAPPAFPDLRSRVAELEQQLVASAARPDTPSYPDLRARVAELETQVATLRDATPAYPDLRSRVTELEHQLAVTQGPAPEPAGDAGQFAEQLADAEGKLATALRGYSLLQAEHDALRARLEQENAQVSTERDSLSARLASSEAEARAAQAEAARLADSLAALQRSGGQANAELAAARALVQQMQGANAVLARENYDLKTRLSGAPVGSPVAPAAGRTHTVAEGDSLSRISQRYYGTPARWQEIFQANRDVVDAQGTLRVGMVLRIP